MERLLKAPLAIYLSVVAFTVMSLVLLFTINSQAQNSQDIWRMVSFDSINMKSQAVWFVVSLLICFPILLLVQRKWLLDFTIPLYLANLILLIITLIFARDIRGSQSWLSIGGMSVQPAEFSKIAVLLFIAKFSSEQKNINTLMSRLVIISAIAVPALIIVAQREVGQVLLYLGLLIPLSMRGVSIFFIYFLVALGLSVYLMLSVGLSTMDIFFSMALLFTVIYLVLYKRDFFKNIIRYIGLGVAMASIFVIYHFLVPFSINQLMKPHHVRRIISMVSTGNEVHDWMSDKTKKVVMDMDIASVEYNVKQAKIAIGSGGLLGKGMSQSTQTKFSFIPEQHTDFIFSAVAEMWGLAGCFLVFGLYIFIFYKLSRMANRISDQFTKFFIMGTFGYLLFNVTINIGMVLGMMPVVGLPLPWLSYGGSSFLSNCVLLTIAVRLDMLNYKKMMMSRH